MSDNLPAPVEPRPLAMIQRALESGIKPSDLKELFDLQVRAEQREAEGAYAEAITAFQVECPIIKQDSPSGTGRKYASYEDIMRAINPLLRKHRIVVTFDTIPSEGEMTTVCRVRVGTVEKCTTVSLPVESASKMMNSMQTGGAAMTYGRRYAITAALNLVFTNEDDDGLGVGDPLVTHAEIDQLDDLWGQYEQKLQLSESAAIAKWHKMLAYGNPSCRVASQLRRSEFQKIMSAIQIKLREAK